MALTEQRIINQITVLPNANAINVQWADQILRDGEIISQTYHRKAYGAGQKAEFEAEVEGSVGYVDKIDWTLIDAANPLSP